nr:GCN5-related N-acetyltransferase [Kibdelosporangium sp. MJ126-NF4]
MFFRLPNADFRQGCGEGNWQAAQDLARSDEPVGLLAMENDDAVGWVAVAPRAVYRRLERSVVAAPPDPDEDLTGVWSVTCFFIHRTARGRGVGAALLDAAVRYATKNGAATVEAYPVDTKGAKTSSGDLYHGTLSMFLDAGFMLVERRGVHRALVRKPVG